MFYSLIRQILFLFKAEFSHTLSLKLLKCLLRCKLLPKHHYPAPRDILDLHLENPVGLAAGLDKNGEYIDVMAAMGFGFIEIGTVTPRPQPGNPKPRLFRLPKAEAIINRMGFNNKGVDYLIEQIKKTKYTGVLGINIGKNFDTPIEKAVDDYLFCLRKVYPYASYITVNISSPNTANLRSLQQGDDFEALLKALKNEQQLLQDQFDRYVPIAIKIAPDLTADEIKQIGKALLHYQLDAVIATNTTIDKEKVHQLKHGDEQGGLSGKPVTEVSTQVIQQLRDTVGDKLPIIGVGGIFSGDDVKAKLAAGATAVQIYTGFIYRGPAVIKEAVSVFNE
jgi:dihydroorotate dehydrogenase